MAMFWWWSSQGMVEQRLNRGEVLPELLEDWNLYPSSYSAQ